MTHSTPKGKSCSTFQADGRHIIATYDYRDEDGTLLFQVCRTADKQFPQRRPAGKGKWTWGLGDTRRVLYRLPELLAAPKDKQVFIVEGEKDVDRLIDLGLVATTNPGGAGKWRDEYSAFLRGWDVTIIPDNDEAGHKHAEAVARSVHEVAASVYTLWLPNLPEKGDVSDWLNNGGTAEILLELAAEAEPWAGTRSEDEHHQARGVRSRSANSGPGARNSERMKILITTEEHEVNAQAAQALQGDSSIYQRGGFLVRVVRDESPAKEGKGIRRPFTPRIEALPQPVLRERLTANAQWFKEKVNIKGEVTFELAHPPGWCVSAVAARGSWPAVRHLDAVVDYPVLRPDGTILASPGYDRSTGLLLEMEGALPNVPQFPTREDAQAAVQNLLDVVVDFPFQANEHKAAWVAALLTPLARFAFHGPAPLFLVDANVPGAGKGLLLDCSARTLTGERFTIATYTDDEDELRKRITSLALAGDRMVLFDNLEGRFGNSVLDAALTASSWEDRVLGGNRMARVPLFTTWYATGNNVAVGADTARRICHIRLESDHERPEERSGFKHPDLLGYVGSRRDQLLSAALTILRAYCVADRPDQQLTPWGSFDGWSRLVRAAIVWVGLPDPGQTRLLLQQRADVTAEGMGVLLLGWEQLDHDRQGLTAAEVVEKLRDEKNQGQSWYAGLRDAIEGMVGKLDARGLGFKLRSYRRRIFSGRYLDRASSAHGVIRWAVYPANQFSAAAASQTSQPSQPSQPEATFQGWDGGNGGDVSPQADDEYDPDAETERRAIEDEGL